MLSIQLPPPSFEEVAFQPEAEYRQTLAPGSAPALLERLSFARPVVVPLRADQAQSDERIAAYFAARAAETRFSLVSLTLGFAPAPDEPITLAVVEVALESAGSPAAAPTVIDMDPDKIADTADLQRALEGSVSIEVSGSKLGFTLKNSSTRPESELFLVAAGLGTQRVGWELSETPGMKIGGKLVLNLIVQTAVGVPATGRITATLQVRRKRFGVIPYRALLDEHPSGQFVCDA